MRFTVPHLPNAPDLRRVEAALIDLDPAAVVDFDALDSSLRLSTLLEPLQVAEALGRAGLAITPGDVRRVPSECCGGCGG
ncbi:hypothetical protein [Lysobacter humi (ex Lee et al. 2017)]